jgi:hypothetical protein
MITQPGVDVKVLIARRVYIALERLGADAELLSIIGSWPRYSRRCGSPVDARGLQRDRKGAASAAVTPGYLCRSSVTCLPSALLSTAASPGPAQLQRHVLLRPADVESASASIPAAIVFIVHPGEFISPSGVGSKQPVESGTKNTRTVVRWKYYQPSRAGA